MTKPAKPINLLTYNITIEGYLPGEFYVDPRTYIIDPPKPVPNWTKENLIFSKNYPKSWSKQMVETAQEEAYQRHKLKTSVVGPINFETSFTSKADGVIQLVISFDRTVDFPSYLKSTSQHARNLEASYSFPTLSLTDATSLLSTFM
jgi:hypothetical protein